MERVVQENHLPRNDDTNALTVIAKSLNDRLTKMMTQRSTSQRFLRAILSRNQPDHGDLVHVVQTLNAGLAEIEDEILKPKEGQGVAQSCIRCIAEPFQESSTTRKRARVSLSPAGGRDDE